MTPPFILLFSVALTFKFSDPKDVLTWETTVRGAKSYMDTDVLKIGAHGIGLEGLIQLFPGVGANGIHGTVFPFTSRAEELLRIHFEIPSGMMTHVPVEVLMSSDIARAMGHFIQIGATSNHFNPVFVVLLYKFRCPICMVTYTTLPF
jgi:hypothetical protein